MKHYNKGFTLMEVMITIAVMAIISIPLYFILSDSSRQVNITAARDYIKQESNKVYKILENDLTQAKKGSFSQSNNEFSIKIRTRASEKADDNLLLASKKNHDAELKYTLEKPKLYRTITEDGKTKKWLVSKVVDSIEIDKSSSSDSPGKLVVNLIMKADQIGIKPEDQPKYEQNKIIIMAEDATSIRDPNWLDVGTVGGVFQTDGNLLKDLKEQFIELGNNALNTVIGTIDDIVGMTAGQIKDKLDDLSLDELKDAIDDLNAGFKDVKAQMTDINSQLSDLQGAVLYGLKKPEDYWYYWLSKSAAAEAAQEENEARDKKAKEVGQLVAEYKEKGQMKWDEVKAKAGAMTASGTEALDNFFKTKSALFDAQEKVGEALSIANKELENFK